MEIGEMFFGQLNFDRSRVIAVTDMETCGS